jgi:hypothetical protein
MFQQFLIIVAIYTLDSEEGSKGGTESTEMNEM